MRSTSCTRTVKDATLSLYSRVASMVSQFSLYPEMLGVSNRLAAVFDFFLSDTITIILSGTQMPIIYKILTHTLHEVIDMIFPFRRESERLQGFTVPQIMRPAFFVPYRLQFSSINVYIFTNFVDYNRQKILTDK